MMTALSPFRYLQMARYIVYKWVDSIPAVKGKGKQRALTYLGQLRKQAREDHLVRTAAMEQSRASSRGPDAPVAGPSRLPDTHRPHGGDGGAGGGPAGDGKGKGRFPILAPDPKWPPGPTDIFRYMNDERLMVSGAVKPPKEIVVLCHGLYGFSTATPIPLFPSLKLHYWANVLDVLRNKIGANVVVVGVKGTGSIQERAEQMHEFLRNTLPKGSGVNFVAHSMGGLDCRYLISTIKPTTYTPLSLTTIGTPHRGSPFMDWCAANIGVGSAAAFATAALTGQTPKSLQLPPYSLRSPLLSRPMKEAKMEKSDTFGSLTSGLTSYLLSIFDSPAYSNLTTSFLRDHFNPATPDSPNVKYTSVAGRISKMSVLHPLWFPKLVLDAAADNGYAEDASNVVYGRDGKKAYEGNDGLVSVSSAKWGEYIGAVDECHHWDLRGEGGLFPSGASTSDDSPKEKAKKEAQEGGGSGSGQGQDQVPGQWDWVGHEHDKSKHGVNEHLGLSDGVAAKIAKQAEDVMAKFERNEQRTEAKSTWELAQVGQVIDWVADFLPGDRSTETGKKQLEEATIEKRASQLASSDGQGQGQSQGQFRTEKERKEEKRKKEKFDLARFYGGLMIKLRDDGY